MQIDITKLLNSYVDVIEINEKVNIPVVSDIVEQA